MQSGFKTILIPVDFSINTEIAVKKALEVADTSETTIHLLHVLQESSSFAKEEPNAWMGHTSALEKLTQWKSTIEETLPLVEVCYWIQYGQVQATIERKAIEIDADLVVIGKQHTHSWFPFLNTVVPSDLSTSSGTAILTAKRGSLHHRIRTIVVPIAETVPHNKMEIISALCKRTNIRIHLVAFSIDDKQEGLLTTPLLKVYQWLKNTLHCPVEYALLNGGNRARAILAYAEKIDADILLLHPDTETKIGWPNKQIPDILPADSKMQVITVRPSGIQ
jgi:nucleotide-binding universal stress UspA family protein